MNEKESADLDTFRLQSLSVVTGLSVPEISECGTKERERERERVTQMHVSFSMPINLTLRHVLKLKQRDNKFI